MQMLAPMALSYAAPALGIGSLFSGMNPMAANALQQSMLGYGTAKLTGSKHPEQAAMYAGLASMPFSFMKANSAANAFNEGIKGKYTDPNLFKTEKFTDIIRPGKEAFYSGPGGLEQQMGIGTYNPSVPDGVRQAFRTPEVGGTFQKQIASLQKDPIDAWDIISGKYKDRMPTMVPEMRDMTVESIDMGDGKFYKDTSFNIDESMRPESVFEGPGKADFYSKVGTGGKGLLGGQMEAGKSYPDYLPMIASQAAGMYGGRPTPEEEWEATKARRRKELAFMYGIDEDQMGGEMENPYYGGGGFWADGGIASINYEQGGPVSGPGGPKDDLIDAKLSDGEFVMTAAAVENLGGGDRMKGAQKMYQMMNQLDPESETVEESMMEVS